MRYRLTPLNITCFLLACYDISLFIFADSPNLVIARAYLIPAILGGLLIDFILQVIIRNRKWLFLIEIVLIVSVVVISQLP